MSDKMSEKMSDEMSDEMSEHASSDPNDDSFHAKTMNGGAPIWSVERLGEVFQNVQESQIKDPQPLVFRTYQELKGSYGDNEIPVKDTYEISTAVRSLTSSKVLGDNCDERTRIKDILRQMDERLETEQENWLESVANNAVRDNTGTDADTSERDVLKYTIEQNQSELQENLCEEVLGPLLHTFVFLGFGSLEDEAQTSSMTNLILAEKLIGVLRAANPDDTSPKTIIFEDPSYTNIDKLWIHKYFTRAGNVRVLASNYLRGVYPCADPPETEKHLDTWENVIWIIAPGAHQPYRQMIADLTLHRLRYRRPVPLAVISASAIDDDSHTKFPYARNPSSDQVKTWLDLYEVRLPLHRGPKTSLTALTLFTQPRGTAQHEKPVEHPVKLLGFGLYEYGEEGSAASYDDYLQISPSPAGSEETDSALLDHLASE